MLKRLLKKDFAKEFLGIIVVFILYFTAGVVKDYSIELRQHTTIFGDLMALLAFFLIFICLIIILYTICSTIEIIIRRIKRKK